MRYRQLEGIQQMIEMQQNKVWEQGPQDQGNHVDRVPGPWLS
jgi:hypothetical protein